MHWPPSDYPHTNEFGIEYHKAMGAPWQPSKHKIALVDLTLTEQERRKYLRSSYKSLLNWGRKNIEWRPSADIDQLQWFHAKIAGRSTRSQLTWDLLEAEVQQGRGDILYGHIGSELVSGSLYIDGGGVCIYWSGVYERSLFPKPLAHYGLWLGMNRAAERGNQWFELGELPEGKGKEANIGKFKAGFATHIIGQGETLGMDEAASPGRGKAASIFRTRQPRDRGAGQATNRGSRINPLRYAGQAPV